MSAPNTNLEKQKRRHAGPLIGMGLVVVFALGVILYWLGEEAANGLSPGQDGPVQQPTSEGQAEPALSPDAPAVGEPEPQED